MKKILRIAQVIGTVTLNRWHPTLDGATLKLAVPMSLEDLTSDQPPAADPLVVLDVFGADVGSRIILSEGGEAAQPFRPLMKPIDAYNAGLIDELHIPPRP